MLKWIRIGYKILLLSLPLSVPLLVGSHNIELPSEPLMILLIFLIGLHLFKTRFKQVDISHPITILGLMWTMWLLIGILFAFNPLVTAKFAMVNLAHWMIFFLGVGILKINTSTMVSKWYNYYLYSLLAVLVFAIYSFSSYNFRMDASVLVSRPFYSDHAFLSACVSILVGIYGAKVIADWGHSSIKLRFIYSGILAILLFIVVISFSRAAWVSLVISSVLIGFILFFKRSKIGAVVSLFIIAGSIFYFFNVAISNTKSNPVSNTGNWLEHLASVTNLKNSVSNLERINRYKCAYRMFLDRPIFGFGGGSFQFAFLPYQRKEEMTRISVTTPGPHPPGRGGNAHSQYLRPLAEAGLLGLLLFLGIMLFVYRTGIRIYYKSDQRIHRIYAIGILFGLTTFFIHGLFNNFLHQGKLAVLFWSSLMMLVMIDQNEKKKEMEKIELAV